jgi:signal transduction histidine kinase
MGKVAEPSCNTIGSQTFRLLCAALKLLLTSAGYYALAVVGTALSVPPSGFAIIWPATAFLVSVLMLVPMRHWWLHLLAVIPAHFHMVYYFQNADLPLIVILTQLTGNFGLAIVTGIVVRTTSEQPLRFDNFRSLLKFILLAGVAVPAVVNALILCLHLRTGLTADFWLSWRQWMLASVFPTITIPPLVITAIHRHLVGRRADLRRAYAELGLLTTVLLVVCVLVFAWDHPQPGYLPILLLPPLPLLLWAAVRLGVGGASLSLLIFAGSVSASALAGRGPFALSSPVEDVLSLQVFLTTISVPLVLLAALVEEQTHTADTLRLSEQRLLALQQRIAHELHDSTSQHLTAMALNLMALRIRASPDTTGIIDDIRSSLREATRELRSFSDLLHPVKAQGNGYHSTLQRCVDGFAMRTELRVKFRGIGTVNELPPAAQEVLQRIVQGALANVDRHASASRVTVKLSRLRQRLHLVIADDGKGVRKEHPPTDDMEQPDFGVSIPGMKALARQLGGRLHIRSRSTGTMVHAVVPIRR